ncbi:MAG: LacI family DNA-binding transcriptional regulator [Rubellimicrobium sp.]|nr:LacI family DNA-binding transcriptional regulator [Rubellimicrobium sp.]
MEQPLTESSGQDVPDPAPRAATIHDVAARAGVSIATVSKALNNGGRMTPETRARVLAAARELSFRPNALARGLHSKRSFAVGLLTDDVYGRFALPVMAGVSEGLIDHGVSVFLCTVEDDPALAQSHLDVMLEKQVDGIVVAGKRVDRLVPVDLAGLTVPVVHVMSEGAPDRVSFRPDEAQGAELAIRHLLAGGRCRVADVTGPVRFRVAIERAEAWAGVLHETGLDQPGGGALFGAWSEAWGHAAVAQLWAQQDRPDAVFCGNDQIARGVIDALRERGVGVPHDVAVVGFDNWEIVAKETRPPLSSVDMNLRELGRQAGLTLLALINGKDVQPGIRALPCTLRVRASSGGPA